MKEKLLTGRSHIWIILVVFLMILVACQSPELTPAISPPITTVIATPFYLETHSSPTIIPTTLSKTPTESSPNALSDPNKFYWSTSFETGDLSELQMGDFGDFVRQGNGAYELVGLPVHSGHYAIALTIDTSQYSPTGAHAAYLFIWKELPENSYYYSAWYYIPSNVKPLGYWNLWQWKSTNDGSTDHSQRVISIGARIQGRGLGLYMVQRLPNGENYNHYQAHNIPLGQWFNIVGYYRQAFESTGQVIIWQDGEEIFNLDRIQTVLSDLSVDWSVNNYSDQIMPSPCTIYIDDIAIYKQRILD